MDRSVVIETGQVEESNLNEEIPLITTDDSKGKKKTICWTFMEHNGPMFEPSYKQLPKNVKFKYNGKEVNLSEDAEEVACLYAKKLHRPCAQETQFKANFFADWRNVMTQEEQLLIKDFSKCDFKGIQKYYIELAKLNKKKGREKKKKEEKQNKDKYGYCLISIDKDEPRKERIKNYKIEPLDLYCSKGLFTGKLKKRIKPEDVIINCSKDSKIPSPPTGHEWKEVRSDNTVSWLAAWICPVTKTNKYIILDTRSRPKQKKDRQKYETARNLHKHINTIRKQYREDWKSENPVERQRGVALYLIDTLGFRAGNETEASLPETVGCCSLKVKNIQLRDNNKIYFDYKGKCSMIYQNEVPIEESVYRNISLFLENKNENDDLFDELNTRILNTYLKQVMSGLSAKVFRTYLASNKFETHLNELTHADHVYQFPTTIQKYVSFFKKALLKIAKLLNHKVNSKSPDSSAKYNISTTLGNYIDPRIVVTWCVRHGILIEKVYSQKLRDQFSWAIDEADPNFLFCRN